MTTISLLISLKMAAMSLRRHAVRSGLALLGIIIGIGSMTVTMALGEGANERLKKEILAMGENWIYIVPGNFLRQGEVKKTRKKEKNLPYGDYLVIRELSSEIQACTPCVETKEMVNAQGNYLVADIQGLTADFFRIEPRGIKLGMPFSPYHDRAAIPVAVLGSDTAKELFQRDNPIGRSILIGTRPFTVIGVFNEAAKKLNRIQNPNLNVVVPFSTVWNKLIIPDENQSLHSIIVRPYNDSHSEQLVASIRRLLRFRHHLSEEQADDFTIWDLQALMQAAHHSSQIFSQFLLIAASVSLVVGGIGIMNVMLVAMTERRKEIGIKMALGATSGQILSQFLIESVLLCLAGGIIGVMGGIGATFLLGAFTDFDWAIRPAPLLLAFAATLTAGLFFGFYPAYKASKLRPVEAL